MVFGNDRGEQFKDRTQTKVHKNAKQRLRRCDSDDAR